MKVIFKRRTNEKAKALESIVAWFESQILKKIKVGQGSETTV
jgi:hypothetical protein